jgi:hypothetical protein
MSQPKTETDNLTLTSPKPSEAPFHAPSMHGKDTESLPLDLQELANLWPQLPDAVREGMIVTARALAKPGNSPE